ncbi:unnamed protein product [Soboliphyme baturini]|uniref:Fork-head domain-containing protein n=1 Tax=Soboliphyme baturini TaxID=241478 RepID=A0A183IIW6_9BILA|nr:unnamed protein product [Soboliphyme baturini]
MAMEAHGNRKVLLTHIYGWIRDNFAYFRNNDTTWQNSVRHNLSLNKQFIKVPRDPRDKGKGSYWMLDPKMKNQYCLRRRNFGDFTPRRCPYPDVVRPQVNPAVKVFLESTREGTPPCKEEPKDCCKFQLIDNVDDIGAQESVYAGSETNLYDFNERLFKKEVEEYDTSYRPLVSEAYGTDEPKVKIEFNWESYDYAEENRTSPALPLDPEVSNLDVRIPTPEWWGNISTASSLLMSPCGLGATRSLDNLVGGGLCPQQQRKDDHPWNENFPTFALDGDGLLLDFDPSRSENLLTETRRFQDCTLFE